MKMSESCVKYVQLGTIVKDIEIAEKIGFLDKFVETDDDGIRCAVREIEIISQLPPIAWHRTKVMLAENVINHLNSQSVDEIWNSFQGDEFQGFFSFFKLVYLNCPGVIKNILENLKKEKIHKL